MIRFGTALKIRQPPYHRCLILSEVADSNDDVVLIRITTDDGNWSDTCCILQPSDWSQLDHRSTVAYSTAKVAKCKAVLEREILNGNFMIIPSPSVDVLHRIINTGLNYKFTPQIAKDAMKRL